MTWVDLSGAFGYGTILTSTQMQNLRDNITALANGDSGAPSIVKVGTYQGDGETSQAITGVGLQGNAVLVASQSDLTTPSAYLRTNGMTATYAISLASGDHTANALISIDSDGFTVGDNGSDLHPNKNGHDYIYMIFH